MGLFTQNVNHYVCPDHFTEKTLSDCLSLKQRENVLLPGTGSKLSKDIMPLVDHRQLQQQNKGLLNGVEVVAAVAQTIERGVLQKGVAAPQVLRRSDALVVTVVTDLALEHLHADDGKKVVEHLRTSTTIGT